MPTPRLHVDGQWLHDPNGNRVSLYGLNTVDPYWGRNYQQMGDASYSDTLRRLSDPERGWHSRVIRVPVQHSLESVGLQRTISEYLRPIVDLLGERGCYVVLDYHQVERWDTDDIDERIRTFWNAVAPAFADDEHVLFELFNEPTQPFGDGPADWDTWRKTAQPWVDLVRSHAPETPIIVGSPRWSSYMKYAADNPFDGEQILYSAHLYPDHFEYYDTDAIATAAEEVPLFISEWGYVADDDKPEYMVGTTADFGEPFDAFLTSIPNANWTAWCADSLWSPAMFDTDGSLRTGDRYMGGFVKQLLADRRDVRRPTVVETPTDAGVRPPNTPSNESNDANSQSPGQRPETVDQREYSCPRIRNFTIRVSFRGDAVSLDAIDVSIAGEGVESAVIPCSHTEPVADGSGWSTVDIVPRHSLPTGTDTLKVHLDTSGRGLVTDLRQVWIEHAPGR